MMVLASSGVFAIKYPENPLSQIIESIAQQVMS